MRQGFRPTLEPPKHRKAVVEARRPYLCLGLSISVTLLVFAIFAVSSWNVFEHRFHKNTRNFDPFDEVSVSEVSDDLSATFCDGYTVTLFGKGQVFLLPHKATVDTTYLQTTNVFLHQMPNRPFNYRANYLLNGSIIDVTACRERGSGGTEARILLIKGESNFDNWRRNEKCVDCVLDSVHVPMNDYCNDNTAKLYHKINSNGKYFLVLFFGRPQNFNHHFNSNPGIRLSGVILRTRYDVKEAEIICNTTGCREWHSKNDCKPMSCYFSLPWQSNKDIVVRLEDFWVEHWNFTTQCNTRVIFWVCLFGVLPVVTIIPVTFLFAWFLCRRTKQNAKALRQREDQRRIREASMGKSRKASSITQNEDYGSVAIQDG